MCIGKHVGRTYASAHARTPAKRNRRGGEEGPVFHFFPRARRTKAIVEDPIVKDFNVCTHTYIIYMQHIRAWPARLCERVRANSRSRAARQRNTCVCMCTRPSRNPSWPPGWHVAYLYQETIGRHCAHETVTTWAGRSVSDERKSTNSKIFHEEVET